MRHEPAYDESKRGPRKQAASAPGVKKTGALRLMPVFRTGAGGATIPEAVREKYEQRYPKPDIQ